ncbi:LmeA family phospholipid-binding protein [Oerskovia enterophila]|uniref:LmeA family phospholipid-binding protein n=1 Tax=Oerskovia enterophila TaxID=43678 RepID=UPI003811FBEB
MKRWWWLIGGLVVLVLVLVVVDRVAVRVTEGAAVRSMEQGDVELTDANLDIQGFPFLTQVVGGELEHVTGTAATATFGGYTVSDLHIDARGVSTRDPYVLQSGTATGLLAPSSLDAVASEAAGSPVTFSTDGNLLVASMSVLGVDLSARLTPRVDGNTIAVDVAALTLGPATITISDLPRPIANLVTNLQVPLDLPTGVTLTSVGVTDGAIRVELSGTDVALADLAAS